MSHPVVFISWQKVLQRLHDKGIRIPAHMSVSDAAMLNKETDTVTSLLTYACTLLQFDKVEVRLVIGFRTYTIFYNPRVQVDI